METSKNTYARIVDNIESITRIDFSIYSNHDIIKDSAISDPNGINIAEIYSNGEPTPYGVVDTRLGVTENKVYCKTCGETALKCPGHFGHIKLAEPVFHMGFLGFLKNVLNCICIKCNKLLVYKNEKEVSKLLKNKHGKQRFAEIRSICKGITHCQKENYGCGTPAHKITIDQKYGNIFILAEAIRKGGEMDETGDIKKRAPQLLTPQLCYDILKSVSNEHCVIMGFDPNKSRPEDMIIANFPMPPVQVRPSIKMEIGSSSTVDDDLTHKLVEIIKSNENLKETRGDSSLIKSTSVNEDFTLLQIHVATFFSNSVSGLPKSLQKNKKVTKSLSERLKGKEGRVRGNLMGKRVDFSGRTVITPDSNIALNEIGIPILIAKNLTYPEVVTKDNIQYLRQLVKNGTKIYPGANFVIKNIVDGEGNEAKHIYHLKHVKKPVPLIPGDIVERHLVNGDIVFFNRQPSLHKLSMMAHKCNIINDPSLLTFRVNVTITDPYGADYDGDEMNIHVPQTVQTVTELILITDAAKHFISPATSKIVINSKQDALFGSYIETYDTTRIDWKDAMDILMTTTIGLKHKIPKDTLIAGKFLYSAIIPPGINIIRKKANDEIDIRIKNGVLLDGKFGKSEISFLNQKIWFQYGSKTTQTFLDNLQHMTLQFLILHGFTIGIKDMVVSKSVYEAIYKIIEAIRKQVLATITEYENDPYILTKEVFEINLQKNLQAVQGDIQKNIMMNLTPKDGLYVTTYSASSGTEMNVGQIVGCLGQVIVEERRIQKKFNHRTLPMFYQHDDSAFARGFCHNSFMSGLNPMEFFFHVMSGREGLINTAIKTADTGYVQRKLIKTMEDIKVEYDGTVRNANDKLIQCVYGDNNISTEKQMDQKIGLIIANNKTIREKYVYSKEEIAKYVKSSYSPELNEKLYQKLVSMRDSMRQIQRNINITSVILESYKLPVDLNQFVMNIMNRENRQTDNIVDPYYVLVKIKEMYSGSHGKILKYDSKKSKIKAKDDKRIKLLYKFYLYDVLSPKKCTHLHKFSQSEFDEIVEYFRNTILLARIEGGEMVGFLGAQSIGEPITQTNLKLFQKSGTGVSITGGLARIKELLGITKNIKTPITEIIVDDKYKSDKVVVSKIASHLKYTTLRDIISSVDICYDPDPMAEDSIMTKDEVTSIFGTEQAKTGCQTEIRGLPWILRFTLSKEKMIERNITMLEIKTSFCYNWSMRHEDSKGSKKEYKKVIEKISQCAIVSNFDNSLVPMIHIRFDANNYNFNTFIQFQDMVVNKYKIKGISNIAESNNVVEKSYTEFDDEGTVINKKQFMIIAEGINLNEMAQINGINLVETRCNDLVTVYETYGVEAARSLFIKEITMAIEGAGVISNYQHIELLADAVTHMGGLIAVNRYGTSKLDTDPISRASFEKTVEQLLTAAVFGESDHIRSVSARIMVGSLINGGTGCFDLLLDHEKVKRALVPKKLVGKMPLVKKTTIIDDLIKRKKIVE